MVSENPVTADTERAIEALACQLYESGTTVIDVGELRRQLFSKEQLDTLTLPLTRGALHEVVAHAQFRAMM